MAQSVVAHMQPVLSLDVAHQADRLLNMASRVWLAGEKKTAILGTTGDSSQHATMQLFKQYNQEEGVSQEESHTGPIQIVAHWVCCHVIQNKKAFALPAHHTMSVFLGWLKLA